MLAALCPASICCTICRYVRTPWPERPTPDCASEVTARPELKLQQLSSRPSGRLAPLANLSAPFLSLPALSREVHARKYVCLLRSSQAGQLHTDFATCSCERPPCIPVLNSRPDLGLHQLQVWTTVVHCVFLPRRLLLPSIYSARPHLRRRLVFSHFVQTLIASLTGAFASLFLLRIIGLVPVSGYQDCAVHLEPCDSRSR